MEREKHRQRMEKKVIRQRMEQDEQREGDKYQKTKTASDLWIKEDMDASNSSQVTNVWKPPPRSQQSSSVKLVEIPKFYVSMAYNGQHNKISIPRNRIR